MFRRSIQILAAAAMLALAAIVGYATLRLSGAPEALAEAEALMADEQYGKAIAVLNLCEGGRSAREDTAIRQRVWRLRLAANAAQGNARGALLDIDNLMRDGLAQDTDLQLERIRMLALAGDGDRSLDGARAFLAEQPEHGVALELAGTACMTACRERLAKATATIVGDVGADRAADARDAMKSYLYRPDGDLEVAQGIETLGAMYGTDARLAAAWQPLWRELRDLRQRMQEGLQFFRRSLEGDRESVAALRAWTMALDAGRRIDDLLMLCEIHRRRFQSEWVAEAGGAAAWALVRAGSYGAAVATAERWLPSNLLQQRIDGKTLGDAAPDLMLARSVAAWRLGDRASLQRNLGDLGVLYNAKIPATVPRHLTAGILHDLNKEARNADANLRIVSDLLLREGPPDDRPDLLADVVPLRLDLQQQLTTPEADVLALLDAWQKARPNALEPKLAFVRHLIGRGKLSAAHAVLAEATASRPHDEQLFALRLELARAGDQQAGQDGASLFAQCRRRGVLAPEVSDPIGYVLCAETALEQKAYEVARECARQAVDAFPRVRPPRQIEIAAALLGKRAPDAVPRCRSLLQMLPADEPTALQALAVHRAAGIPTAEVLFHAMRACRPGAELRTELLRVALATNPAEAAALATSASRDATAPDELRILAAHALAVSGRATDARQLLDALRAGDRPVAPARRQELAEAVMAWIEAAAAVTADERLAAEAAGTVHRMGIAEPAAAASLLRTAAALEGTHPATAHCLCGLALAVGDPESRSGSAYALAGRLAARQRQFRLAEEHWLAALAFPDGRAAAEDLARLCVAGGRIERAMLVHQMVETATDAALAARCGKTGAAEALAAAAVVRDGADLLAQATLAVLGKPSPVEWKPGPAPENEARLELLSLLHAPEFDADAVPRAEAAVEADPGSTTARLLLARAKLGAGLPAEAGRIHEALLQKGGNSLLWREIALASEQPGYPLTKALDDAVMTAVTTGDFAGSTATLTFGLQRIASAFEAAGHAAAAAQTRTSLWLQLPRQSIVSADDIDRVARLPDAHNAWYALGQILPDQTGATRALVRGRLYGLAQTLLAAQHPESEAVYRTALQHLQSEGAYGCIVHLLLDHGDRFPQQRPDPTATRQMLLGQLALAAAGRDPGPWLQRSVDRLVRDHGPASTLDDLEGTLRRCPTSLPLWRARSVVLSHMQGGGRGIADLRAVLAHADAPAETLAFLILAAADGRVAASDRQLFDSLPEALRSSPDGLFARGLLALRSGRPDEAVPLLAKAEPRRDGLHLWAQALAHLQSKDPAGGAAARTALEALARDYPSSSLAPNAGSFSIQLRPR